MLALSLVLALVGSASDATGGSSRVRFDLSGYFGYEPITVQQSTNSSEQETSIRGGGDLTLTFYPDQAVIDDESPQSLQAFLQHVTHLSVGLGGGGFHTGADSSGAPDRTEAGGQLSVSADVYLHRAVALGLGLGYSTSAVSDGGPSSQTMAVPFFLALGLHFSQTRFDLTWGATPAKVGDADWKVRDWAGFGLELRTVVGDRHVGEVGVVLIDGGARGYASWEWFVSRRLGVFLGASGGYGRYYLDSTILYGRAGGELGVAYWWSQRFGFELRYDATWESSERSGALQNVVTLALFVRSLCLDAEGLACSRSRPSERSSTNFDSREPRGH